MAAVKINFILIFFFLFFPDTHISVMFGQILPPRFPQNGQCSTPRSRSLCWPEDVTILAVIRTAPNGAIRSYVELCMIQQQRV